SAGTGGAVGPGGAGRWPRHHGAHPLGPPGRRPWSVVVVSASAGAGGDGARDTPQRQATGRPVPLRLRQVVALHHRPRGLPLAALERVGPRVLRGAARAGSLLSPGAPRLEREVAEDHLCHVGTPDPLRRAVPPGDDDAAAVATAS